MYIASPEKRGERMEERTGEKGKRGLEKGWKERENSRVNHASV